MTTKAFPKKKRAGDRSAQHCAVELSTKAYDEHPNSAKLRGAQQHQKCALCTVHCALCTVQVNIEELSPGSQSRPQAIPLCITCPLGIHTLRYAYSHTISM